MYTSAKGWVTNIFFHKWPITDSHIGNPLFFHFLQKYIWKYLQYAVIQTVTEEHGKKFYSHFNWENNLPYVIYFWWYQILMKFKRMETLYIGTSSIKLSNKVSIHVMSFIPNVILQNMHIITTVIYFF